MSCTIDTIIACDECGYNANGDDRHCTASQIRATRSGWVYRNGKDYCPECAAKLGLRVRRPNVADQQRAP